MPLDVEPTVRGNVLLRDGVAVVLGKDSLELNQAREDGATLYMPHWATCRSAGEHR